MAEGHPWAAYYPLSKLWIEVELARERINARISTEAVLMQSVISSIVNKNGATALKDQLENLNHG